MQKDKNNLDPSTTSAIPCPTLQSERFIIRAFQRSDLSRFTQYRANEEVAKYQSWSDYSYSDALKLFNAMDYPHFACAGHWYQLAIEQKSDHELVGDLAVHFIDHEKMEIGFTIAKECQRRGVAFEALSTLLSYLFTELHKRTVVAFVDIRNTASIRLLEKSGFRRAANLSADSSPQAGWGDEYFYIKERQT